MYRIYVTLKDRKIEYRCRNANVKLVANDLFRLQLTDEVDSVVSLFFSSANLLSIETVEV